MSCRRSLPKAELRRLSRDDGGQWQLDASRKDAQGRGAWICGQVECTNEKALRRFFRGQATRIAEELRSTAGSRDAKDGGMNV